MEVAISHRNHNSTIHHPVGAASLIVGRMVRIDGQRRPVKQQRGLFPLCKKILGFVAATCQASYKSIAKTTCRSHPARIPAEAVILAPARPPFARTLSKPVLRALEGPVLRALEACPGPSKGLLRALEACPEALEGGALSPHTLTPTTRANADVPATLPPWNAHSRNCNRTSPPPPRHGAPRTHGPYRRPRAVRPLTPGGCFSRAQKWYKGFCS